MILEVSNLTKVVIKKLFIAFCLLSSICFPATAQSIDRQSLIQINSVQVQPNKRFAMQLTETWNEGVSFNMVLMTVKDFSCQTGIGTITNIQGNIGIDVFTQQPNQSANFFTDRVYSKTLTNFCQNL